MASPVSDNALNQIFRDARTYNAWEDRDLPETLIRAVYDLQKWGPTSANCCPARYTFLHSAEAKERLIPLMMGANQDKTRAAPWVVIISYDMEFNQKIPQLFPHNPGAKDWFNVDKARFMTAFRNGTLQSAYFLIAARSLGLDCGPMSGFDNDAVDKEFFIGKGGEKESWRSNWICNLGYGTQEDLFPRSPRLAFDEACEIL